MKSTLKILFTSSLLCLYMHKINTPSNIEKIKPCCIYIYMTMIEKSPHMILFLFS